VFYNNSRSITLDSVKYTTFGGASENLISETEKDTYNRIHDKSKSAVKN